MCSPCTCKRHMDHVQVHGQNLSRLCKSVQPAEGFSFSGTFLVCKLELPCTNCSFWGVLWCPLMEKCLIRISLRMERTVPGNSPGYSEPIWREALEYVCHM